MHEDHLDQIDIKKQLVDQIVETTQVKQEVKIDHVFIDGVIEKYKEDV